MKKESTEAKISRRSEDSRLSCRDIEENFPQTSRNRVHPLQGKPWLGVVDYRC